MAERRDGREARTRFLLGHLTADVYKDACAAELFRDAINLMPDMIAAHVELGMVCCRLEKYGEAVRSFRQAIRINPAAVRAAVRDGPEALDRLRRVLYGDLSAVVHTEEEAAPSAPDYIRASWALVGLGREHAAAGRDGEAVAVLEAALKLDETHPYAAALLALTLLLMRAGGGEVSAGGVLRKLKPRLWKLIFES
jgi:tetratricopeptide (TPR) repeat protein